MLSAVLDSEPGRTFAKTALLAYVASALTVGSLGMKTMLPLRIFALIGNVIFIAYGVLEQSFFLALVNLVILPVNVFRLIEIKRLIQNVRDAANENHVFDALMPFARRITP